MNHKIKSGKEIDCEINSLFDNNKNENELIKKIKNYLKNVTGKELIHKKTIETTIFFAILDKAEENIVILKDNCKLYKMYPNLKYEYECRLKVRPLDDVSIVKLGKIFEEIAAESIIYNIIEIMDELEDYRDLDCTTSESVKLLAEKNESYGKFFEFLSSNMDVSVIIKNYLKKLKNKVVTELIINKTVPLKTVLIFFDYDKNIKENTDNMYVLLDKKFSRLSIQKTILENLSKKKNRLIPIPSIMYKMSY